MGQATLPLLLKQSQSMFALALAAAFWHHWLQYIALCTPTTCLDFDRDLCSLGGGCRHHLCKSNSSSRPFNASSFLSLPWSGSEKLLGAGSAGLSLAGDPPSMAYMQ